MAKAAGGNLTDEALIALAVENHQAAILELINRHKLMVFNLAYRILGSYHDAEEVAQDTFVKAFQSLNTFRNDSHFKTWLFRICHNTCISFKRRKVYTHVELVDREFMSNGLSVESNPVEQSDRVRFLQDAIQTLDNEDATIVSLFYGDELPTNEIAEIVNMSEGNVRIRLHRARKKLKEQLFIQLKNEAFTL